MLAGCILLGIAVSLDATNVQDPKRSEQKRELINEALKPYRFQSLSHKLQPDYVWPVNIHDVAVSVWLRNPLEESENAYDVQFIAHFRIPGKRFDPVVVDAVLSRTSSRRAWVDIVGDLWVRDDVRMPTTSDDDVVNKVRGFASNAFSLAKRAAFFEPFEPVSLPYKQSLREPEVTAYLERPLRALSADDVFTLVRHWDMEPGSYGGSGVRRGFAWAYKYQGISIFIQQARKNKHPEESPLYFEVSPLIEGFELVARLECETESINAIRSQLEKDFEDWSFVSHPFNSINSYINATRQPYMFKADKKIGDLRTFLLDSGKEVKQMHKTGS